MIARILTKTNRFCSFLTDFSIKGLKQCTNLIDKLQHSFLDFVQPMDSHESDNHGSGLADRIPWDEFEVKYAKLPQVIRVMLPSLFAMALEP